VRALRSGCESMVAEYAVGRREPFCRSIGGYLQSACCHSPTQALSPAGRDEANACVVNDAERDHPGRAERYWACRSSGRGDQALGPHERSGVAGR
jgi:hypothetical protein